MNRFADLPLRSRISLIVVVSCMSAIAVASGTSVVANNLRGRAEFAQRIQTLAFMTADNNRAALAFGNVAAAKRILETFRAEPSVDSVALYEMDGSVYASFVRDGLQSPDLSQALAIDGHRFSATGLEVRQTLALLDQDLGILQIHSNLDALNSRLLADALVSLALGAMGCLFATGVAWRLQRSVSEPILQLAKTVESVRAKATGTLVSSDPNPGRDEVGNLVRSFNEMMNELQERETQLVASESNYRMLTEQASDGIVILNDAGQLLSANRAARDLLGYADEDAALFHANDFLDSGDLSKRSLAVEELRSGRAILSELRLRRQDGSWINVEMNAKTLDDGRIQAILRDLSERSRLEERLLQGQKMEAIRRLAGAGSPTTSTISSQ